MDREAIIAAAQQDAEAARFLLGNKLLTGALDRLEARYIQAWRNSDALDSEGREVAHFRLKALDEFRSELTSVLEGGRVAEHNFKRR